MICIFRKTNTRILCKKIVIKFYILRFFLQNIEKEYTFQQVVRLQMEDWPWWIMAFVGSVCVGIIMPIFGLYYGQIFSVCSCN